MIVVIERTGPNVTLERKVVQIINVAPFGLTSGIPASVFTDAGQLISSTGAGAPSILDKPTADGQVLTSDLTLPRKVKWDAPIGEPNNLLINGGFDLAQRLISPGTLTTIADQGFGADRWRQARETADLQYQWNDATGQSGLASRSYGTYKKITTAGKFFVSQIVEGLNSVPLRGRTVTFQLKMKASAVKTIRMGIFELQNAGTMDAPPAPLVTAWGAAGVDPTMGTNIAIVVGAQSKVVTAVWQNFNVTVVVPSNSKNLLCAFWTNNQFAALDGLDVAEAGLYAANAAQTWLPRLYENECREAERFYQVPFDMSAGYRTAAYTVRASTNILSVHVPLRTRMRAAPVVGTNVSGWNASGIPTGSEAAAYDFTTAGAVTISGALSFTFLDASTTQISINVTAGISFSGTQGDPCDFHLGPDARIYANAEI